MFAGEVLGARFGEEPVDSDKKGACRRGKNGSAHVLPVANELVSEDLLGLYERGLVVHGCAGTDVPYGEEGKGEESLRVVVGKARRQYGPPACWQVTISSMQYQVKSQGERNTATQTHQSWPITTTLSTFSASRMSMMSAEISLYLYISLSVGRDVPP